MIRQDADTELSPSAAALSIDFSDSTGQVSLTGGVHGDVFRTGLGADILNGGGGDDILEGGGTANEDDDVGDVGDTFDGGEGIDTVSYEHATTNAIVFLGKIEQQYNSGVAKGDKLSGIEILVGSRFGDYLGGSDDNDTLIGGEGNDYLEGEGRPDTLIGGTGDDYYYVDKADDRVMEAADEGSDRVYASASYALTAGQSIEVLATKTAASTSAISLTGNNLAQTIKGSAGANVLAGLGGSDTLQGLGGADTFLFKALTDSTTAGEGRDAILDFSHAQRNWIDLHLIDADTSVNGNQG